MFNKRASPYLILMSMLALIYAVYYYWYSMNPAAVFVSYLLGSVAIMLAVFYWDNRNLGKPILKLAREMTFSFGGSGPVNLVEGVIPDRSHSAEDCRGRWSVVGRHHGTDRNSQGVQELAPADQRYLQYALRHRFAVPAYCRESPEERIYTPERTRGHGLSV